MGSSNFSMNFGLILWCLPSILMVYGYSYDFHFVFRNYLKLFSVFDQNYMVHILFFLYILRQLNSFISTNLSFTFLFGNKWHGLQLLLPLFCDKNGVFSNCIILYRISLAIGMVHQVSHLFWMFSIPDIKHVLPAT